MKVPPAQIAQTSHLNQRLDRCLIVFLCFIWMHEKIGDIYSMRFFL